MLFLSKFVIWLLSPLGMAFCLAGLALVLAWRRRRRLRGSMALAALAFVWLWAWSMPMLSHWLGNSIEQRYPQVPIAALAKAPAIVVLGGAVSPPAIGGLEVDLHSGADRVWYVARLFHAGKAPLLILSGGSDLERHPYSEARAMAIFLTDLGVPAQAMALEEQSRNTRQNAAFSAALLRARGINRILLVTSALHMPRAMALFATQGLQVIPAPTDFEASQPPPPGILAWLPDAGALDASGKAIKEIVGRWVGW
jgi:uncharacterized SAM-binding protein YcdF (DUF218 family)